MSMRILRSDKIPAIPASRRRRPQQVERSSPVETHESNDGGERALPGTAAPPERLEAALERDRGGDGIRGGGRPT